MNKEKTTPIIETKRYAELLKMVSDRNNALETEVGRLTMINRAYEEQFSDMRKAIRMLEAEVSNLKKQNQSK